MPECGTTKRIRNNQKVAPDVIQRTSNVPIFARNRSIASHLANRPTHPIEYHTRGGSSVLLERKIIGVICVYFPRGRHEVRRIGQVERDTQCHKLHRAVWIHCTY